MKILVLSDSHSGMRFMRQCVETIKPQAVVHLGDYYDDGETLKELYPHIELHQVPVTVTAIAVRPGCMRCCAMMYAACGCL